MGTPHRKYTRDILQQAVNRADSVMDILRLLSIPIAGGNHAHIKKMIIAFGIDTSHFQRRRRGGQIRKLTNQDVADFLTVGHIRRQPNKRLTKALLHIGRKYQCVECNITNTYNGKPVVLEVDHVNSDWSDNRPNNLQFMCPTCHSQKTATDWSMKKMRHQIQKPVSIQEIELPPFLPKGRSHQRKYPNDPLWNNRPRPWARKVERPSKENLLRMVWTKPTSLIAVELGVSDKAIDKWCKLYGISKPNRGYWTRRRAGQTHEEALLDAPEPLYRHISEESGNEIVRLATEGHGTREIARRVGRHHTSVGRYLRRAKVGAREGIPPSIGKSTGYEPV